MLRLKLVGLAALLTASMALAHGGATGLVKARMDQMVAFGAAMKSIKDGLASGDMTAVQAGGAALERHGGAAMLANFESGEMQHVSEASPAIWERWDDFTAQAMALERMARDQQSAQTPEGAQPIFAAITKSCSACHDIYRIKK